MQTYHGWVPVIVNASTRYQFRVTPVMTGGVAGRTKTSNWTLATHGKFLITRHSCDTLVFDKNM